MMQQSAHYQMPFLLIGEIIDIGSEDGELVPVKDVPQNPDDDAGTDRAIGYTVLVDMPNGSRIPFSNVTQACLFGGIGDFFQCRLRASSDPSGIFKFPQEIRDGDKAGSSLGNRVIIAFIGGDIRKPCIVGYLPHPKRVLDIPDQTRWDTQAKLSYKGMEVVIDDLGQMKILTRGAPSEVDDITKEQTEPNEITDSEPVELPERESLAPLPSPALLPNMPPLLPNGPSLPVPTQNDNLKYPDPKYTVETGYLQLGQWYVVDTEGQTVFLDRDSKTITLSNGADTIQIDKANKKIFLVSSGDVELTCQNDFVASITGNKHNTVSANEWYAVKGDEYRNVGNTRTANIVDKDAIKAGTSWTVDIGTAEQVEGGTGKSGDKHSASINLSTGNSFTMDDDNIFLVHKTGALFNIDKDGNVMILSKDGSMISMDSASSNINIMSKKGTLLAIGETITCAGKSGKEIITIKDGEVTIASGDTLNLSAPSVNISAGNINVGDKATMSAVLGENLQTWLDGHTHPTGAGPSGSPILPTAMYTKTPLDILSSAVKVRKGGP